MGEKVLILYNILVVMIICNGCNACEVYKVGGSSGWTTINITHSRYKSWAASKIFHIGDTLLFEYNKEFHNVVRVTRDNFNRCNSTTPFSTWATGKDSFTITGPGHFYFICGLPGHCWAGQKVDIRVTGQHKPEHGPSPSPRPTPSPLSPTLIPPAQRPKSGSSYLPSSWKLCSLVAAIALPALVFQI